MTDQRRPQAAMDPRALSMPGGTLRPDNPYYIERPADVQIHALAPHVGETLIIKAPRQMGKSSLLSHYLAHCQEQGKQCVFIDFSSFEQADCVTYAQFLTKIALLLTRAMRLQLAHPPQLTSQTDLTWFCEDHILPASSAPLTFAFDETDRVLGREYQADFFTMLRMWHNNRANPTLAWEKVDLALVISTEPYLLIKEADRSPFNVAPPIELEPFSLDQCRELNRRYADVLTDPQVEQLWEVLRGQPYLTRLAYYRICCEHPDFATLLTRAADERGPFGDHLRALLAKLHAQPELLKALKDVIRNGTVAHDDLYYRLHGAGLVKREGQRINPANLVYARYFKSYKD